jgi:hypothetical protein
MDGTRVDGMLQGLATSTSRRHALGALIGTTAGVLVGGGLVAAVKGGNGKSNKGGNGKSNKGGNGKGQGRGRAKVGFCHRNADGSFNYIEVGARAAKAHMNHGDIPIEAGVASPEAFCVSQNPAS